MISDFEPTIRIPVTIHEDGRITLFYDDIPLNQIFKHGIGDLTVPTIHLVDQRWRSLFTHQVTQVVANVGENLYYRIRTADSDAYFSIERKFRDVCIEITEASQYVGTFAPILLRESLRIEAYGTKSTRLLPCACWLPGLDREAISVNQAGTFLSEVFEPKRHSHTVNVYRDIFLAQEGEKMIPLDVKRKKAEAAAEAFVMENLGNLDFLAGPSAIVQLPLFPWLSEESE